MKNKNMTQEIVWILIVATFITGFFLLQGTITGYTILETQSTVLTDIQIHSETPISPLLEITIPIKPLTTITPNLTYSYIQIKPIAENFTYADILFKLDNSWITLNKLDKSEIALYIFNNTWKQLPTSLEKETKEFTYYKARTPNLGLFAIAKATKIIHIEEPIQIEKPTKPITPLLTLAVTILSIILTIELLSLLKHKLKFILILLAFAIMILGLTVQQPITKEILTYGLIPISIIALIISITLTIILNKLRNYKLYPYIRNILISILTILIFIISITITYTKEIIIYAILPLISIAMIASIISTLLFHIFRKLFKKPERKIKKEKFKKKKKKV